MAEPQGADAPLLRAEWRPSSHCPPYMCVAAVVGDALRRGVAVLGGREGMPRSLGSVYGGSVTRFLGGGLRGVESRVIDTPDVASDYSGIAVTRDGCTLLVSDCWGGPHAIRVLCDGSLLRVVGGVGSGPLQFRYPRQVWVASDGVVFVADYGNDRVQVLTPTLDFHGVVGVGSLQHPVGVCANADVVVVSENGPYRISVFHRGDGALLRRFDGRTRGDSQLSCPLGLCFVSGDRYVAIADVSSSRVSVFSVDGEFIRHVGVGVLKYPHSVAASPYDELVVADTGNDRAVVFSSEGDVAVTMGRGDFTGVARARRFCLRRGS
jgi:DNA-binding beta-propeller fold protein YncE